LQEESEIKKEREAKDDGRYIIYYTFEDEGEGLVDRDGDEEG
jgi:hypothetical protein